MINSNYLTLLATGSIIALTALPVLAEADPAASKVKVTCDRQNPVPTVVATLSNRGTSQVTPILSFLPQYFSPEDALSNCAATANKLDIFYSLERMNYLASDTISEKPVVCAVERRGLGCDSYNSEILFSLAQPVSPTELLYNMLGNDFKSSQAPSSRTISRIYTDLRPLWWPF